MIRPKLIAAAFLLLFALGVASCSSNSSKSSQEANAGTAEPQPHQIINAEVPPGTVFQPIEQMKDFDMTSRIRVTQDPQNPNEGIAAVSIKFTSKLTGTLKNVQVAVWLPQEVRRYSGTPLIGTNLDHWHEDLSPKQPSMYVDALLHFKGYENRAVVRAAFDGPTRVKISWEGGAQFFEFPGTLWKDLDANETP